VSCKLIYGQDEFIKKWVSEKIGFPDFGQAVAIGVELDGVLIAGVVYHNYVESPSGKPIMCEVSMAAIDSRWANRYTLRQLLRYPFIDLGVERLQVSTPVESKGVRKINEKLGFTYEGTGRKAHFLGGDVDVLSMLKHECKWIK
jgi:RimJ/RimL family protein N-acetyltransferase